MLLDPDDIVQEGDEILLWGKFHDLSKAYTGRAYIGQAVKYTDNQFRRLVNLAQWRDGEPHDCRFFQAMDGTCFVCGKKKPASEKP